MTEQEKLELLTIALERIAKKSDKWQADVNKPKLRLLELIAKNALRKIKSDEDVPALQCDGWRRKGGAFSFGPPVWERCEKIAIVSIAVTQYGISGLESAELPACQLCWQEAINNTQIEINCVRPLAIIEK